MKNTVGAWKEKIRELLSRRARYDALLVVAGVSITNVFSALAGPHWHYAFLESLAVAVGLGVIAFGLADKRDRESEQLLQDLRNAKTEASIAERSLEKKIADATRLARLAGIQGYIEHK